MHEALRNPNSQIPNRTIPSHIIEKSKTVNRSSKRKRNVTYKGTSLRLWTEFSTENLQARKEWGDQYSKYQKKITVTIITLNVNG